MDITKFTSCGLVLSLVFLLLSTYAHSQELYFVDAHSQVDQNIDLDSIVELMESAGVRKTILAARGKRRSREIADLADAHPNRIVAAVRTKSRHYIRNTGKFYKELSKQVNSGRFGAMAEVLLYHAQKGDLAGEVVVFPDEEQVKAAFEAARNKGWPFVLHIEFASLSGDLRNRFFTKMEEFLKQYSEHPIALIHMGQLQANEVTMLINKYANIHFLTSHSNPVVAARSNQPWINMFVNNTLAPEWKSLIVANPKRFIFALDNVWPEHWRNGYREQVEVWREALSELPPDVAYAVAHGNAEALWKLK